MATDRTAFDVRSAVRIRWTIRAATPGRPSDRQGGCRSGDESASEILGIDAGDLPSGRAGPAAVDRGVERGVISQIRQVADGVAGVGGRLAVRIRERSPALPEIGAQQAERALQVLELSAAV